MRMHPGQVEIEIEAVRAAVADQIVGARGRPVVAVASAGTVVAPFRIGDDLVARVPLVPQDADARARLLAEGEHARRLAASLPLEVSQLVAIGEAFPGYDGVWSVWTWVEGASLDALTPDASADLDRGRLAADLAAVLRAFHALPTGGAGWGGGGRGSRPLADTDWVRTSILRSAHLLDADAATATWERALRAAPLAGPPRTIHGDPVPGNLVIRDGRLAGLIDIAVPQIGDPASDLAPAWTVFEEPERSLFREALGLDAAAWERGRGWAFEMAIGGLHYYEETNPVFARQAARTLARLMDDGAASGLGGAGGVR